MFITTNFSNGGDKSCGIYVDGGQESHYYEY
jgi:hypothetical protein